MAYGLEVYDANGRLLLTSEDKLPRILGTFNVTTATGSMAVTSADGYPVNELFARRVGYFPKYDYPANLGRGTLVNVVYTVGSTIYWKNLTLVGGIATIAYGDAG